MTPGGIIVPPILAIMLFVNPRALAVFAVQTAICYFIYKAFIAKRALSKDWLALITMSVSGIISITTMLVFRHINSTGLEAEVGMISYILPGLTTLAMAKYGVEKAVAGMSLVAVAVVVCIVALTTFIPVEFWTLISGGLQRYSQLHLYEFYPSILGGLAVAVLMMWRFKIRNGGYVIGAVMAAIIIQSWSQALLIVAAVGICYAVIRFVLNRTHVIGLKRFVMCLSVAYILTLCINVFATQVWIDGFAVSMLAPIQIIAVFTNELTTQSIGPSAVGVPVSILAALAIGVAI